MLLFARGCWEARGGRGQIPTAPIKLPAVSSAVSGTGSRNVPAVAHVASCGVESCRALGRPPAART